MPNAAVPPVAHSLIVASPMKPAVLVASLGAVVSAIGVTAILWVTNLWLTAGAYPSQSLFWLAALLAMAAWASVHLLRRRPAASGTQVWRPFTRTFLPIAALLLAASGWFAGSVDPVAVAYATAMRSDLRTVLEAQDRFRADSGRYAADLDALFGPTRLRFGPPSTGVEELELALTADGWTASARHARSPRRCAIFVGTTPLGPAVRERVPVCTRPRPPFPLMPHLVGLLLAATGVGVASLAGRLERGG